MDEQVSQLALFTQDSYFEVWQGHLLEVLTYRYWSGNISVFEIWHS